MRPTDNTEIRGRSLRLRFAVTLAVALLLSGALRHLVVHAEAGAIGFWLFEDVGQANLVPGCVSGMTLAGFDIDGDGRPVAAWREENGCGGTPRVFWARKDLASGTWFQHEFRSNQTYQGGADGDYAHQIVLRPSDGRPFMIFADVGPSNEINTYRTDLKASPTGGVQTYLENVGPPQNCNYVTYGAAFAPNAAADALPSWTTNLAQCNDVGYIGLRGSRFLSSITKPRSDHARGPDGTDHILWNSGSNVYYTQGQQTDPPSQVRGTGLLLFNDVNRFGGEVVIDIDRFGVLHAIVRGSEAGSDSDPGTVKYLFSTNNGATWSAPQYVDVSHAAKGISLAVDSAGVPAIAYWAWNSGLVYARREGAGGSWVTSGVGWFPITDFPATTILRFDRFDVPVIAFYDWSVNRLRLARPAPAGSERTVDLRVAASASPDPVPAGRNLTYTVTITNAGNTHATGVALSEMLPPGTTFVQSDPAPAGQDGQTLTFDRWRVMSNNVFAGWLTAGATGTIRVTVTAPSAAGTLKHDVSATSSQPEVDPDDNVHVLTTAVLGPACFAPTDSMWSWWLADGDAGDLINGWSLAAPQGVSYSPGVLGQAFELDGITQYLQSTTWWDDNIYYPGEGSFSLQAWIRTSRNTGSQTIASKYECGDYCGGSSAYFFSISGGRLAVWLRDASRGETSAAGTTPVADGSFHHVALVRDMAALELRLYVDGALDAAVLLAGGASGPIRDDDAQRDYFVVGGAYQGGTGTLRDLFQGAIDDVAYFRRALTADEIAATAAARGTAACGAAANHPPVVQNPGDQESVEGSSVLLPIVASDADGDPLTYHASGLPPGLSIDPATGLIAGVLGYDAAGTYVAELTVDDGQGVPVQQQWTWVVSNVNATPTVAAPLADLTVPEDDPTAQVNLAGVFADADGDSLTYSAASSDATIVGVALDAATNQLRLPLASNAWGTATIVVRATDAGGLFAEDSFIVTVTPVNDGPAITSALPTQSAEGETIAVQVTAVDPDGDTLTFSALDLPPGLSVGSATGLISGSLGYSAAGTYRPLLSVSDGQGINRTVGWTWIVTNVNRSPMAAGVAPVTVKEGRPRSVDLGTAVVDPDGDPLVYAVAAVSAPDVVGASIDAATGALTLVFGQPGTALVTIRAFDPGALFAEVTLTVQAIENRPPVIDEVTVQRWKAGAPLALQVAATDPDGDPLTWHATGLPAGVAMEPDGRIVGVPGSPSYGTAHISVFDGDGGEAHVQFSWTVVTPLVRDLALRLTGPETARAGFAVVSYRLQVHNVGEYVVDSHAVRLSVSGGSFFETPDACSRDSVSQLTCSGLALDSGQSTELHASVASWRGHGSQFIVTAELLTASPGDQNDLNNRASAATTFVRSPADLSVTVAAPDNVRPGEAFDTTVTVANADGSVESAARRVVVRLTAGAGDGLELIAAPGCTRDGQAFTCELLELLPGGSRAWTMRMRAPLRVGMVTLTADAVSADADADPDDNTASKAIAVSGPPLVVAADLGISIAAPATVLFPDDVIAVVSVRNNGPDPIDAYAATISIIGTGLEYAAQDPASGCSTAVAVERITDPGPYAGPTSGTLVESLVGPITCAGVALPVDGVQQFQVRLRSARAGTPQLRAEIAQSRRGPDPIGDPVGANNRADATLVVRDRIADLAVAAAGPATARVGRNVTYQVTVTNHGPDPAHGVVLRPSFNDAQLVPVTSSACTREQAGPGGAFSWWLFVCRLPDALPAGESRELAVTFSVRQPSAEIVVGFAVSGTGSDPFGANSTTEVRTSIEGSADVVVAISGDGRLVPGGTGEVVVSTRNLGPGDATEVTLHVTADGGELTAWPAGCVATPGGVECAIGSLAAAAIVERRFAVRPTTTLGRVRIAATASTGSYDALAGNNTATHTLLVYDTLPQADLQVTGAVSGGGSSKATVLFRVTNAGPSNATRVRMHVSASGASFGAPATCMLLASSPGDTFSRREYVCTAPVRAGDSSELAFVAMPAGTGARNNARISLQAVAAEVDGVPLTDPIGLNNAAALAFQLRR